MSVIIRLQNLPWSANALDIRQYFQGMSIPEGGVHIVGGELGDAFIAFSTDEDARQAMLIDGGKIKEVKIKLFLSSRSEMHKVIDTARAQSMSMQNFMHMTSAQLPIPATQIPLQSSSVMQSQLPIKTATGNTIPSMSLVDTSNDTVKGEHDSEKRDQDCESVSSKDTKRIRRGRSKSRDRTKSRSRSRDRSYKSRDRYRDRRRRDRSRSRGSRDRRDRRRHRERSRSRDRSSRRSSRDRKREDHSNIENSNGMKNVNKGMDIPATPTPLKPGFTNSGWVSVGTGEKPEESPFANPVGFTVGKTLAEPSTAIQRQVPKKEAQNAQHIPLPKTQPPPVSQQIPNKELTSSVTHPPIMPHPPPFPQLPLEVSNDDNRPSTFPPSHQPPISKPLSNQTLMFMPNQQSEASNSIPQGQPASMNMPLMSGWNPNMMPPIMNTSHMHLGNLPLDKPPIPMMNPQMGMYMMRPPIMPPNEKTHLLNDPRMQGVGVFRGQNINEQQRNDFKTPQTNNFSSQILTYPEEMFNSSLKGPFTNACVEIRNMSMSATNTDIKKFFQGLQISEDGIKIVTDKKGNKIGIAYVRFAQKFFKDMALKKSGQGLNNSIVEVLHIEDGIFEKATDFSDYSENFFKEDLNYQDEYDTMDSPSDPLNSRESFIDLVINEVPPFATEREIYNLFKGFNIEDAFVLSGTGRKPSTGYIRFKTPSDARRALASSARFTIGYSQIKVSICYEHEYSEARDRKNMEEEDEEFMDAKDSRYNQDNRGNRGYNQSTNKPLLQTPNIKSFDPRSVHSNNNVNNFSSRYDRRQPDSTRPARDNFPKKPPLEDLYQKPFPKESGRFQARVYPRDDFVENRRLFGDKRPYPQSNYNKRTSVAEQSSKIHELQEEIAESSQSPTLNSNDEPISEVADIKKEEISDGVELPLKIKTERSQSPLLPDPNFKFSQQLEKTIKQKGLEEERDTTMDCDTDCIILKGLPFSANDRDILDFFSDEGLNPTQIHIMLDKMGHPAGDAFCEFNSHEEVLRAMKKNGSLIGRNVVVVEPIPRSEMLLAIPPPLDAFPHHRRPDFPRFPPRGRGHPGFIPRGRGRGTFHGRHASELNLESQSINNFGKPGCVLALENVPFRADVNDILEFFRGYFITKENVIRRFDELGKPTGDARVCFNSPEDANRALKSLNQRHLFNRQIYLTFI